MSLAHQSPCKSSCRTVCICGPRTLLARWKTGEALDASSLVNTVESKRASSNKAEVEDKHRRLASDLHIRAVAQACTCAHHRHKNKD